MTSLRHLLGVALALAALGCRATFGAAGYDRGAPHQEDALPVVVAVEEAPPELMSALRRGLPASVVAEAGDPVESRLGTDVRVDVSCTTSERPGGRAATVAPFLLTAGVVPLVIRYDLRCQMEGRLEDGTVVRRYEYRVVYTTALGWLMVPLHFGKHGTAAFVERNALAQFSDDLDRDVRAGLYGPIDDDVRTYAARRRALIEQLAELPGYFWCRRRANPLAQVCTVAADLDGFLAALAREKVVVVAAAERAAWVARLAAAGADDPEQVLAALRVVYAHDPDPLAATKAVAVDLWLGRRVLRSSLGEGEDRNRVELSSPWQVTEAGP